MTPDQKNILSAFGAGKLQELDALITALGRKGVALHDVPDLVAAYIAEARAEMASAEKKAAIARTPLAPRCKGCGLPMTLLPVNDSPATRVDGPWRSMWLCRCGADEIYNQADVTTVAQALGEV